MQGEAVSNIQENTQTPTVQEESEEEEVCHILSVEVISALKLALTANSELLDFLMSALVNETGRASPAHQEFLDFLNF